jgi:DNA-binding NarL/FixJ family response regulator
MDPIRILVADDHALVRAGIRALLEALDGVEVVAEAGDGRQALAMARAHRPDVLLSDIAMPHLTGLELAAVVARELAPTRVVILSMHAGPPTPRQREILRLVAEGLTTKGIARRLGISDKTVESHRAQMMDRLGIHDLAGLIRYAIRTGLVGPEEWE